MRQHEFVGVTAQPYPENSISKGNEQVRLRCWAMMRVASFRDHKSNLPKVSGRKSLSLFSMTLRSTSRGDTVASARHTVLDGRGPVRGCVQAALGRFSGIFSPIRQNPGSCEIQPTNSTKSKRGFSSVQSSSLLFAVLCSCLCSSLWTIFGPVCRFPNDESLYNP